MKNQLIQTSVGAKHQSRSLIDSKDESNTSSRVGAKLATKENEKRNSNPIIIWSEIPGPKAIGYRDATVSPVQTAACLHHGCLSALASVQPAPGQPVRLLSASKRFLIHSVLILIEPVANYNLLISVTTHLTSLSRRTLAATLLVLCNSLQFYHRTSMWFPT